MDVTKLDPKLQEAYKNVMNQSTTAQPTPTATPVASPSPAAPISQPVTTPAPTQQKVSYPINGAAVIGGAKKKSKVSPVLLVVIGLIFFVVYTLFWAKLLNVSLPFLP